MSLPEWTIDFIVFAKITEINMTVVDYLPSSCSITHTAESGCGATRQSTIALLPDFGTKLVVWSNLHCSVDSTEHTPVCVAFV